MPQVNYSSNGLVLVKKVSGTGVSSIDIDNCFSNTYSQYKLIGDLTTSGSLVDVNAKLRVGGVNSSTNIYSYQYMLASTSVVLGARATSQAAMTYLFGTKASGLSEIAISEIRNPFQTDYTSSITMFPQGSSSTLNVDWFVNSTSTTTSYDGLSVFAASGTLTGTVYVYGYINS
jgi:hypothetical protein